MLTQIAQVSGAEVGHRVVFEIAPDVLDRIELRGVGGQILQRQRSVLLFDVVFHQARAVGLQAVPDDQHLATDGRLQRLQELNDLRTLDRAREETEVEAPEAHSGNHRELLPGEAVLQNRSLALRGPGACATGAFRQSRLVNKDDYSALPCGDFFTAGHLFFFHSAMAASSRCRARPVGRCTLHPNCCSIRHTEGCESSIWKRSLISLAMRRSVHSSLANPAANAPVLSALSSSVRCASSSFGGRPNRFGRSRPRIPPCGWRFDQRNTDWRLTPTRRATSAGHTPLASSRIPCLRRLSNSTR